MAKQVGPSRSTLGKLGTAGVSGAVVLLGLVGDQANLIGEGDARLVVLVAGVVLVVSVGLIVLDWLRSRESTSDQPPASLRARSGRDTAQIAGNQFSGATTIVVGGETFGRIDQAPGTVQPRDQPVLDVSPYGTPDILLSNFRDHAAMVHLKIENEPAKSSVDAAGLFVRLTASGPGIPSPITITARPRSAADYPANERRVAIRRGDHEDFDVAIKFFGERDAYMVNSEGFNLGGRRTEWRLPPGTYSLAVLVFHDSGSSEYAFRLVNAADGALSLEPITAEHHVDQDRQQLITEIKAFLLTATNEAAWKAEPLWYPGTAREYVGRAVAILGDELEIDQPADDPSSRLYYYAILRQVLRALTGDRAEEKRHPAQEVVASADGRSDHAEPVMPPVLVGIPDDAIAGHVQDMCRERTSAIADGETLLASLWNLPTNAGASHYRQYKVEWNTWSRRVDAYGGRWWKQAREAINKEGAALSGEARPFLEPSWRGDMIKSVKDRLAWLQKYGADQCA